MTWNVGITIDISDDHPGANSATYGLASGVFYMVTGKPGYSGSGYTGEAPASKTWVEHIIAYDKLGDPVRTWDEEDGYATLHSFDFAIDNTAGFYDFLVDNQYHVIGRPIKVYLFIDDASSVIWTGIIEKVQYDKTHYKFICGDKNDHKTIPPTEANDEIYPLIDEDVKGETIPVTLGYVRRAKMLPLKEETDRIKLNVISGTAYYVAGMNAFSKSTNYVYIDTQGIEFPAGYFIGYYLKLLYGDEEQNLLIENNEETITNSTRLTLADWFESDPTADSLSSTNTNDVWYFEIYKFRSTQVVSENPINSIEDSQESSGKDVSFYDTDLQKYQHIGNLIIKSDVTDIDNTERPGVTIKAIDDDKLADVNDYIPIRPYSIIPPTSGTVKNAGILTNIHYDFGTKTGGTLIVGSENANLYDVDKDTNVTVLSSSGLYVGYQYVTNVIFFDVKLPEQLKTKEYQKVYLLIDCSIQASIDLDSVKIGVEYQGIDYSGREADWMFQNAGDSFYNIYNSDTGDTPNISTEQNQNLIPFVYYGEKTGDDSNFNTRRAVLDLSDAIANSNWLKIYKSIRVHLWTKCWDLSSSFTLTQKFKEFTFIGLNEVEFSSQATYAKVKGEEYTESGPTLQSSTVDGAIRQIMTKYDGIPHADIDTAYLDRDNWLIGSQLTQQRNSRDYLKELCRQTFTAIVPTREGDRRVITWRNQTLAFTSHDASKIKRVHSFKKTPLNKVYNQFQIEYNNDPGMKKPRHKLSISNIDQSAFPAFTVSTGSDTDRSTGFTSFTVYESDDKWTAVFTYSSGQSWIEEGKKISWTDNTNYLAFGIIQPATIPATTFTVEFENKYGLVNGTTYSSGTVTENGSGVAKWAVWVSGVPSYPKSKGYWEKCAASYAKNRKINPMPAKLAKCNWFPKNTDWGLSTEDAASLFLSDCVEWYTRDKDIAEYSILYSDTGADINLADLIDFTDPDYTNGDTRQGYCTKFKIRLKERDIVIGLKLIPTDLEEYDYIQEAYTNTDEIQEAYSNTDEIQEQAV